MSGTLPDLLSPHLSLGKVYTRGDLVPITGVKGVHALYLGVFKRRDGRSVLLFVTQIKKNGRTQYDDRLEGDTLYWEGQEQRGTDNDIILADERGLELLVFYRRRWNEFPGDGFRYLGHFKYIEHVTPNGPGATRFVLQRIAEPLLRPTDADDNDAFDPTYLKDAREKVLREIKARHGQRSFRDALIDAYDGRCAITGCDVLDVLEAAHITPYLGPATNHVTNGLLLRADLHTLFDLGLIAVDPKTKYVLIAPSIKDPVYQTLHGKPLRLTKLSTSAPNDKALRQHRSDCGW